MFKIKKRLQGFEACKLGTAFKDRFLLVVYYIAVRINRKRGISYFKKPRFVSISYKNLSFDYSIANLDDYRIIEEMYINKQYALDTDEPIKTVLDLGSNVGTSIIYFLAEYPEAHIYGFEPTAYCFDRLSKTVGGRKHVTLEKKAIDSEDGKKVSIYTHPLGHSGSSNFFIEGGTSEEVSTITMDSIMKKYELTMIDILKVDIEGFEYEIFKNFINSSSVRYIMVEIHPFLSGHSQEEFLKLLPDFKVTKIEQNPYSGKAIQINLIRK